MGLFGRGRDDNQADQTSATANASTDSTLTSGIDFSAYDLSTVRDDVRSIVDLPTAIAKTARWAFGIPVGVGVLVWIFFSSRMSGWAFIPYVLIAMLLAAPAGALIGGLLVARRRLDTVSQATSRVVNVVGEMHADVMQVRQGAEQTSVKQVATGLLEHAVFPIVFGVAEGFAANASGPFSRFSGQATEFSLGLVQKSVVGAVDRLPDREIGSILDGSGEAVADVTAALTELNGTYQQVVGGIDGVVGTVSKATLGSLVGAAFLSLVPLTIWLVIGWLLT